MYVWEQSEIVKTHRLTVAMVWALLGVGAVRPSTWAALVRRDLAEHASDGGHRLTATGQEVSASLETESRRTGATQDVADELHNLTAEPEDQAPDITTDDGPTFPECEDAGAHVESDHETGDCGWPPLWPNGAPAPLPSLDGPEIPSLTRADEVRAGDYVHHAGKERRVIGTRTEGRDIVLSTVHGTLTMPPGTPLRVSPAQLSLSLAG